MKKLNDFNFNGRGRTTTYDWDTILDGSIYELKHGEDFQCTIASMRTNATSQAKRRGGKVRTSKTDEDTLVLQYHTDED